MQLRMPDRCFLTVGDGEQKAVRELAVSEYMAADDVTLRLMQQAESLRVCVRATDTPLRGVRLVWDLTQAEQWDKGETVRVLGDAWERGYGDLGWKEIRAERCMPWYFAASNGSDANRDMAGRLTQTFGVQVRPAAMCLWQYDGERVTLWLDARCGGQGVQLLGRELTLANVIFGEYRDVSAFDALCDFCDQLSPDPLKGGEDIWGSNNWYYAYGQSSHSDIIRDTALVVELSEGCSRMPYMVIDDGWQKNPVNAPWEPNERFPDMQRLAHEMKSMGVHPGIWIRYLIDATHAVDLPEECRRGEGGYAFDPSHPLVLDYVARCTEMIVDWGYEMIKHDFSTFDIFGRWGFETTDFLTKGDWHFYDRSKTSAEIVINLYQTILDHAKDTKILGCNCIGHLCAGLVHANRTGDDTSGFEWERTRKMGINTLAFRLPQQGRLFGADADCVGIKGMVPWENNRQWLELLARSATPLFVSCDPTVVTEQQKSDLKAAYRLWNDCMDKKNAGSYAFCPVDWMENATPRLYAWRDGDGEHFVRYDWTDVNATGTLQL